MGEDMVERVADALCDECLKTFGAHEMLGDLCDKLARAAIQALRVPTDAMLEAGPGEPYMDRDVWARMIDAALSGAQK